MFLSHRELRVMAACGSLFFSNVKMMVIFGAANLAILLLVMEVKRYAFTSLWCAYAAVASVIILAYSGEATESGRFYMPRNVIKSGMGDFSSTAQPGDVRPSVRDAGTNLADAWRNRPAKSKQLDGDRLDTR